MFMKQMKMHLLSGCTEEILFMEKGGESLCGICREVINNEISVAITKAVYLIYRVRN